MMFCVAKARVERGFTLFELLVVACIIAITATLLLNRVRSYQGMAEQATVGQTINALQSALNMRVAKLLVENRMSEIVALERENPIDWLAKKPGNYAGEVFGDARDVKPGQWYFDLQARELVYLAVEEEERKQADAHGALRFRIRVIGKHERFAPTGQPGGVEGVVIEQSSTRAGKPGVF